MTARTVSGPATSTSVASHADGVVEWWESAVVYQVYLRSFRDGNGDGVGDLIGLRAGLGSIAALGCDAIWLNPCYVSPQRDHGYDIADYMAIDAAYGDLDDFDALVSEAHQLGIRVLMDMVANHCSMDHVWFQQALRSERGSAARERFLFRDGRGKDGELPPNNWQSVFGGPAWTRIDEPDGTAGQWYFHAFDSAQPDFNWRNPTVPGYFDEVFKFWFDRGVDGFRIDVAHGLFKSPLMEDWPGADNGVGGHNYAMWDQPEVHDIYRRWRALGDAYPEPKYFVGEIWVPSTQSLVAYLRPDELHQAFNFELLVQPWDARAMQKAIKRGVDAARSTGAPAWTLSNHDVHRTATRYGQEQPTEALDPADMIAAARRRGPVDTELGGRRATAAAALLLALPGAAFLYQGEELGLPEVLDLPPSARQDPIWLRSGGKELGRDGCRVPLPWEPSGATFGFGPAELAHAWLPQPKFFANYARSVQEALDESPLSTYRNLLGARRKLFSGSDAPQWLYGAGDGVLAFKRANGACVVNLNSGPIRIPEHWSLATPLVSTVSTSEPGLVPANSATWFATNTQDAASADAVIAHARHIKAI
jgi:alpha-glucosidase